MDDQILPRQLGNYRLLEELRRGGEARVYRGTDGAGEVVAIKVLHIRDTTDDIRRRFEREVQNLQRLGGHRHIISLLDFGIVGTSVYLVMPYIPEGSLGDLLRKGQQFSSAEILTFLRQTADALIYAHERKIIHRDLNPNNLLYRNQGVLLSDFGIAFDAEGAETLTRPTHGTEHYRAPEQDRGQPVAASDQYALAVLACYLFTRKYPDTDRADALPAAFPRISEVLNRALARDPDQRFPSIKDFANALDRAALQDILQEKTQSVPLKSVLLPSQPPSSSSLNRSHFLEHAITSLLTILLTLLVVFFAVRLPWSFLPSTVVQARVQPGPTPIQSGACHLYLSQPASSQSANVIKIGVDLPLSGYDVHDGQPLLNAIELAIANAKNEVHDDNGHTYTLEVYACDDVSPSTHLHDPPTGERNIETLASDPQVAAIIGPFNSDVAVNELPKASGDDIAMISPSTTSSCLTAPQPPGYCNIPSLLPKNGIITFFRTATRATKTGATLADYLVKQHYTQAFIIEDRGLYGEDLAQGFSREWSQTEKSPTIGGGGPIDPASQASLDAYQQAISSFNPKDPTHSVILYAGNTPTATLVYALIEQNPQLRGVTFAGGGGIINASFVTDIEGLQQSGPVYAIAPVGRVNGNDLRNNLDFYSRYLSSYNDRPTLYSAGAYDCTEIVIDAIERVIDGKVPRVTLMTPPGSSGNPHDFRDAVIKAMRGTQYDGITDHYAFDAFGDTINQTFSLYQLDLQSQQWGYIP